MQSIVLDIIDKLGYFGVLLLIFAENLFPPIPSEVILSFSGFVTTVTQLKVWVMVVFATLGSLLGAYVLYVAGRLLSPARMTQLLGGKMTKRLGFEQQDVDAARQKFLKKGSISVLLCRCVPIVRSLISIPAGMAQMPFLKFTLYTTAGSAVWNTVLISLGALAGENRNAIIHYFSAFQNSTKILLLVAAVVALLLLWRKKRK